MKLFLDTKARRFVKSAASNVALQTLHLKRRDQVPLEIVFVSNNAVVTAPTGTTTTVGLKAKFSDANFLALAAPGTAVLDLYTEPVEEAFADNPAAIPALLEVRWSAPGESLRTATLQVELQNSVILGTEGTPAVIPDLKATQEEAEAGMSNETWMTPLRTAQAIAVLAPPPTWDSILEKPEEFPPEAHEHTAADITDFAAAVQAVSPAEHTHEISEVNGLSAALADATSAAVTQVGGDLALKADLINGTVPATQLPPLSYQTTRHDGDGTTVAFAPPGTLTASDSPSAISVTINGVTQEPVTDYTLDVATNRVVLSGPLPLGDKIVITRPILLPSNSTLSAEQLGAATTQALSVESAARTQADAALQSALDGKQPSGTYATLVNGKVPADQLPAANSAVTSVAGKTGAVTLAKADVGLGNVDNTSDLNKPISTTTQSALDSKANEGFSAGGKVQQARELCDTTTQEVALRIENSEVIFPEDGGSAQDLISSFRSKLLINNADNTSDLDKPVSTATQAALDGKVSNYEGQADAAPAAVELRDTEQPNNVVLKYDNRADGWEIDNPANFRAALGAASESETQAALDEKAASGLDQSGQVQQALELTDLGTELPTLRLSLGQVFVAESYRANFRAALGAASTSALADKLGLSASSYIIAQPGDNFATKYAQAKTLTPNGGAKSATNRASLILFPGTYPLSSELAIDAEFVDLVGLGAQFQSPAVIISNNTLNVTANDVRVSGISVGTQAFKIGDNKPLQVFENCVGGSASFGYGLTVSGLFYGCVGGSESFGSSSVASGTFRNCNGGDLSFGSGGELSGQLLFCRLTEPTSAYQTPSGSGIIRFCLDGDNNIVNADAP